MRILNKKIPLVLLFGDLLCFVLSLWLALITRYGWSLDEEILSDHVLPFSLLFVVWLLVFFISGLYERRSVILRNRLFSSVINAQIINATITVLFFYLVPWFGISPKITLLIYLVISSVLIVVWRSQGYYLVSLKRREEDAILIASGKDADDLRAVVNANNSYNFRFVSKFDLDKPETLNLDTLVHKIYSENVGVIVVDLYNPKIEAILPTLYKLIFSQVRFIDMHEVYEDVFNRAPLSLMRESWFLENVSTAPKAMYDVLKRLMDIVIAGILGTLSLVLYPFVALIIKLDDGGPVFIKQKRVGWNNSSIEITKFRSMKSSDGGKWVTEDDDRITRAGRFLRASRIDEFPQLWSVVRGHLSLIGPRPDIYDLGMKLSKEIPYYTIRGVIKPGLSGWAQIEQDLPPQSIEETKLRLAYDFYYIKNRSFLLDLKIALRTIKTLAMRVGK